MGIGTNIKRLLAAKKMTIKELSERTGIPVNTLYSITRRDSESTKSGYLSKISAVLGVGVDEIVSIPVAQVITGLDVLSNPDADIPGYLAKPITPGDIADVAAELSQESRKRLMEYALELSDLDRLRAAAQEQEQ